MNGSASPLLDDDNPWPGLAAFDEGSQRWFHGRDEEIAALAARVEASPLVVLFGKSGLGKTSLLKAGLMPLLRTRALLPVVVRLMLQPGAPAAAQQLADALRAVIAQQGVDAPAFAEGESLWRYLHRSGLEFWDRQNFPCTPVFVIDQFEEVFTVGESVPALVQRWRVDLGDLAENRIPAGMEATAGLQLREMHCKFLVSLREDFLPELEGWRRAVPSLGKVRMRLLPLSPAQALQAVHEAAPHLMDEPLARRIVDFVAAAQAEPAEAAQEDTPARSAEVEPALLSLFCQGLNAKRRLQGKARFDDALLDDAKQGILADYYRSCFDGMPESVSRFVATELITEKGYRNSVSKDDATPAHLSEAQLATLIDRRLLRVEERYGAQRIELTHDLLTRVVREHRDRLRRSDEAAAAMARAEAERRALQERLDKERGDAERRQLAQELRAARRFRALAGALALMLAMAIGLAWVAVQRGERAAHAEAVARHERQEAEAQRGVAMTQRSKAVEESQLANARLKRITDSIGMKQAVLSGDRSRISAYLESPGARSALRFTASAEPMGYKNPQGQWVHKFTMMPTDALDDLRRKVAVITYRMDHPTFQNSLLATGPERGFSASYIGWGCLTYVVVLVEYIDPDRGSEIADLDMCQALNWSTALKPAQ